MATELGQAYVQITPSAQGIKGAVESIFGKEIPEGGEKPAKSLAGKIKGALAAAGIGAAVTKSLMEGAKLEQSIGGIETLYKKSADIIKKNAADAWKTAGLSANEYMEQSTTFAASLLQSLGGNTKKAANYADMAIVDMSDNANKFGTDIESIQNAYQGFSKQNYTMLDNLKLGYGGTKTEMQRLLDDAGKISKQKYDIGNLSDVYEAIHVVQKELGVTGTTAKEAASTFSGSFSSMKSAATNLLGNIMLGENVGESMAALIEASKVFLINNLAPAIGRILMSIPKMLTAAVPILTSTISDLLKQIINYISNNGGSIFSNIGKLLIDLAKALETNLPIISQSIFSFIGKLGNMFVTNLPAIISTIYNVAQTIILTLIKGIIQCIPIALNAIKNLLGVITLPIKNLIAKMKGFGISMIKKLAEGVASLVSSIKIKATNIKNAFLSPLQSMKDKVKSIIDKIKGFFNVSLKLKGVKLPHIKLTREAIGDSFLGKAAKFFGLKSIPKFSVDWYKTGGIFSNPSVIGVGEAGSEAVVPLDSLWSKFDSLTNSITSLSKSNNNTNVSSVPIIINLDGSEIAKTTIEYINGQTIRYGTSPIIT